MNVVVKPEFLSRHKERADSVLPKLLDVSLVAASDSMLELHSAMRYAVTNGGKRIRPTLSYATAKALGVPLDAVDVPACAIEMVHAYSLVHDDLPAMDNDDLRRGLPTCHKKFGEAMAILAGDALQALAFTVLSQHQDDRLSPTNKIHMIELLGQASGAAGMAVGQAIDLAAVGKKIPLEQLEEMHRHKTGMLIRASIMISTMIGAGPDADVTARLSRFANDIGLLFQIVDDILDVVSDTATLGKPQGADNALNKPTYPALLGLEGARKHAKMTHEQALEQLEGLDDGFDELRQISTFIIERTY